MANSYISEKLKAARIASGLKQREVYEWLGVGQSTFSAWETGASEPSIGVFLRLCQKYGIQDIYAYFMPDSPLQGLWKDLDPSFLNRLLALPPRGRAAVKNCLDFEYKASMQKRIPLQPRNIMVYTQVATAGRGSYLDDQDAEVCHIEAPETASYAIRISGDSMEPLIHDGDLVFVQRQNELASGEIGIFTYNGECFCKMWDNRNGVPKLISLNKKYAPIFVQASDNLYVNGKVLL